MLLFGFYTSKLLLGIRLPEQRVSFLAAKVIGNKPSTLFPHFFSQITVCPVVGASPVPAGVVSKGA